MRFGYAVCAYSLISPLTIALRRTRAEVRSTMTAGPVSVALQAGTGHNAAVRVRLLIAEAVSVTGTRMSVVAVPWVVVQTTGDALLTGVTAFVEMGALVAARAIDIAPSE